MFISIPVEFFIPGLLSEGFRYNSKSNAMEYDSGENNVIESFNKDHIRDEEFCEIPNIVYDIEDDRNKRFKIKVDTDNGVILKGDKDDTRDINEETIEEKSKELVGDIEAIIKEVTDITENNMETNIREGMEEDIEEIKNYSLEDVNIERESMVDENMVDEKS